MKTKNCRSLMAVMVLWSVAESVTPAWAVPFNGDPEMTREITAPLNGTTMDDYVIDLARAADVNVIADATQFPQPSAVLAYPATSGAIEGLQGPRREHWGPSLINLLGDFTAQKKLSVLRAQPRTFLFWSEPDPLELVRLMLPDPNNQNPPDAEDLAPARNALRDYLKQAHGWGGTAAERHDQVDIGARIADLPLPLRSLIMAEVRRQFVRPEKILPLQDDFWKQARVKIREVKIPPANETISHFVVKDGTGTTEFYMAELNRPTAPVAAPVAAAAKTEAAKTQTPADVQPAQDAPDELAIPLLQADAALSVKVSPEAKRLSLRDLLAQLQQQSGVTLTMADDAPAAETRVTARVKDMPLATFMGALSRLYGARWAKGAGNSYVMHDSDDGELGRKLRQMGDPVRYRYRYILGTRRERQEENKALANEVLEKADAAAVKSDEGVALSSLPVALQERVRRAVQEPFAETLAVKLYGVDEILSRDLRLRFNTASHGITQMAGGHSHVWSMNRNTLHFTVETSDGQFVAPIFTALNFPIVSAEDARQPRPSRRR